VFSHLVVVKQDDVACCLLHISGRMSIGFRSAKVV
jgi:hypothetical protein